MTHAPSSFSIRWSNGTALVECIPLMEQGVVHAFTTRLGGTSQGHAEGMNLGFSVGDDPDSVVSNRRQVLGILGLDIDSVVCGNQVHGNRVEAVSEAHRGLGALSREDALHGTDCLCTTDPGVVLMCLTADCLPVIVFDPVARALGIAHAGWRGTAARAAQALVYTMAREYSTSPRDCIAALGPSIGPCCYVVGPEVREAFAGSGAFADIQGTLRLDIKESNRVQLLQVGLTPDNVHVCSLCTHCRPDLFYSSRRYKGLTGRMAAIAALPPNDHCDRGEV